MSERPHSRKRNDSGKTSNVHKRGSGLGGGPSGNGNYGRGNGNSSFSRNVTRGGGIGILALLLFMFFGNGLGGGGTVEPTPVPTPTPVVTPAPTPVPATPAPASNATHNPFHFGTQTSHNSTYVDASSSSVNTTVANGARKKYTTLKGNGKDTVTIMVYMCGTDLETNYGMATQDINEMAQAQYSNKVNIVFETGGTKKWKNNLFANNTNQRWRLADRNSVERLDANVGQRAMTDPNTLADFIRFSAKNYPADRYMLILWDHGGGSVQGYGYDQLYPNGSMSVDEIAQALNAGGVKFDILGFDACLMGNMETAIAVEPYADYLLASEETEPGTGWYYTDWLTMLAKNTSTSSLDLGKQIIDDFVTKRQAGQTAQDKNTLSLVDLAEFKNTVPAALSSFSKRISSDVKGNNYQNVADARSSTKEFAQQNRLDQVDLVHFCQVLNTPESKALASAVQNCIKYNRTKNVNNAYGISIYFPYRNTKYVNALTRIYDNIDFDSDYRDAVKAFATLEASGQIVTNNTSNSIFNMLGGGSTSNGVSLGSDDILNLLLGGGAQQQQQPTNPYGSLSQLLGGGSYDTQAVDIFSQLFGRAHVDSSEIVLSEKNGQTVLSLDKEDWEQIQNVKLNVWVDDGEGFIDLGLDNIFEFTDDGDLVIDYDGKWMALNDQPAAYYLLSDEYVDDSNYSTTGYIPALLNGEEVNLIVEFSDENPEGVVLGADKVYELPMGDNDEYTANTAGKLIPVNDGDVIDLICDYYDYDGNFTDRYNLSDPITVNGELELSDITLTNERMLYGYCLTDIYNSDRWTPMQEY